MPQISYTISGSSGGVNVSIKKSGDGTERCTSNCSGMGNGSHVSNFNNVDLQKGVNHSINLVLSEGACSDSSNQTICCPATGGSISGSVTPAQSTTQTYTVSGIDGIYSESGGNGGFSIIGGNASFIGTPSSGIASVNVGTSSFTLCYNILSCGQSRSICININPQGGGCSLSVSSVSISC